MTDSTPTSPTPTNTPTTTVHEPHTKSGLSATEISQMADFTRQDLKDGKVTAEQAEKIFTELNTPIEQRGPDTRTDEQKTLDTHFPAAKPEDYRIAYGQPGEDVKQTPELKAFDQSARTWMSTAGMPKNLGDSLVTMIGKVTQQTQGMSDSELEAYGQKEFEKLEKVHGPKLDERLRDAAVMVDELERTQKGLKQLLKSRGVGDSALVANLLMSHAPIYHARKGR